MQLITNFGAMNPDELETGLKKSIVPWMGKTMKHMEILLNTLLAEAGLDLTKNQMLLLKFVRQGVNSQSDLCMITERDKSSLTRLIQSLEKKGFVTRTAHELDKRQQVVELTESGNNMLDSAMPVIETCIAKVEQGINRTELEAAKEVIKQLLGNVELELKQLNKS